VLPIAALASTVSLLFSGCVSSAGDTATPTPSEKAHELQIGVQLFMWPWDSIASECTEVLGPAGISWVLTSPPQEHVKGAAWWTVYQPVSYQLESRLGTRDEFAQMVQTCADAGVDVIADAVALQEVPIQFVLYVLSISILTTHFYPQKEASLYFAETVTDFCFLIKGRRCFYADLFAPAAN
jgi:hypothetical protein